MGQLKQVQMSFAPVEDRILMRISTSSNEELRFWLTRRYVRVLWPLLLKAAGHDPEVASQPLPQSRDAVMSFKHEQAVSKANFKEEFKAGDAALPLGETPVLLARAQLRPGNNGNVILSLHPHSASGIDLTMDSNLLHSITRLLRETSQRTDWELNLSLPGDSLSGAPTPDTPLN